MNFKFDTINLSSTMEGGFAFNQLQITAAVYTRFQSFLNLKHRTAARVYCQEIAFLIRFSTSCILLSFNVDCWNPFPCAILFFKLTNCFTEDIINPAISLVNLWWFWLYLLVVAKCMSIGTNLLLHFQIYLQSPYWLIYVFAYPQTHEFGLYCCAYKRWVMGLRIKRDGSSGWSKQHLGVSTNTRNLSALSRLFPWVVLLKSAW